LYSDHSITEEEDGEEYDDVDEDLKAQILGRNEAEQEKETTAEEGSDLGQLFDGSLFTYLWRCGGLMVSALVPGSSGPGSSPGQGTLCCVLKQDT